MSNNQLSAVNQAARSWRDVLPIHPAAEAFPRLSEFELRELGQDIKQNGLRVPIAYRFTEESNVYEVLAGISRLDAMETAGIAFRLVFGGDGELSITVDGFEFFERYIAQPQRINSDPYEFVISTNIHRRHLDAERRQSLLIELIARTPEKSDRQLGKKLGVDHKTIAKARAKGKQLGRIPQLERTVGKDGKVRKLPVRSGTQPAKAAIKDFGRTASVKSMALLETPQPEPASVPVLSPTVPLPVNTPVSTQDGNDIDPVESAAARKAALVVLERVADDYAANCSAPSTWHLGLTSALRKACLCLSEDDADADVLRAFKQFAKLVTDINVPIDALGVHVRRRTLQ
jgi:hypothetical protein